ncbi:MAG: deoxyribodipyrimidine photo-lyase, partial [Nitrosopumilaceae archaeon]|nr:deoxyribodipyrimidine photo-lyase [Nitrosopumilaceae archaeon]NIV65757.1 deoxyribodipyrimidine photo-lyase [Nitrosopumilaceae archaeon]
MPKTALFWFRRDLRTKDNIGLYNAVKQNDEVIPVFIFEDKILNTLKPNNPRFGFLVDALENLNKQL